MIEVTENTVVAKPSIYEKHFFAIKSDKGLYFKYKSNEFDERINNAKTYAKQDTAINECKQLLKIKAQYPTRKWTWQKLYVVELTFVEKE